MRTLSRWESTLLCGDSLVRNHLFGEWSLERLTGILEFCRESMIWGSVRA